MKFNCGESRAERRVRKWRERKAFLSNWHCKFIWWPTRIGPNDCRWLETVERKGTYYSSAYGGLWVWEYRPVDIYFQYS